MWAASCLASCCAACACDACRTVVSGISRRSARIAYCGINYFHQTPDKEWFQTDAVLRVSLGQTDAVLRVSLGNFLFFTILAVLMIGVKNQKDPRDSLHHGGWVMKIICWCLLVLLMIFLPNGIISLYEATSKFGAGLFLLVQVVLLLDFVHGWSDEWVGYNEQFWYTALLFVSLICYLATFSFSAVLFHWFTPSGQDCGLNTFFIVITLMFAFIFAIVALHPADYLELDDDVHANGAVSTPMVKGVEGHEVAKSSAAISDNPQSTANSAGNPQVSEIKSSTNSMNSNKEPLTDGFAAAENISVFSVPVGLSTSSSAGTGTQAAAEMNSIAEQTEKISEMIPISSNSEASKEIKSELLSSATEAANEADGPDKTVKKSTLHFGDVSKRMEGGPSSMASSAKGLFSFGAQSNGATLSNGLSSTSSVTMSVSSPAQISSSSNDQSTVPSSVSLSSLLPVSNGNAASSSSLGISAGTVFSTTPIGGLPNFGSSSQFSTSVSAPPVFSSSFQFGSPGVPSTSSSALGSVAGTKLSETAFSNATVGLFSEKSIGTASVGKTMSSFNASTSKSASGETQTSPPAIFSSQASSSAVALTSSMPNFSSQSASSPSSNIFGFSAPTSVNCSASLSTGSNPFTTGSGPVSSVGFPSVTAPVSSSSNTSSSLFGLQSSKPAAPAPIFGTSPQFSGFNFGSVASGTSGASNNTPIMFGATSSSSAASISNPIVFGATSSTSAASNNTPIVFGANSSSSSANSEMFSFGAGSSAPSVFSVPSAAASTAAPSMPFSSQPAFASSTSQPFAFGLTSPTGNNDRISMEDSMAEDSVQVSTPAAPVFGQQISAPSSSFVFNGAAQSTGSPFQFSGQQNQFASQSTPFQPSGSLEFNAGGAGSFSLGSGGVDKASRRIVKVKKQIRRK